MVLSLSPSSFSSSSLPVRSALLQGFVDRLVEFLLLFELLQFLSELNDRIGIVG